MKPNVPLVAISTVFLCLIPDPAAAYVGPGTGLAVLGAALALIAGLILGVLGFVWYPFKKAYRAIFKRGADPSDQSPT